MWPGIKDQVTEFVRKCDTFDKVSLDTVGKLPTTPDGNKHILITQDNLSNYCIAVPIPDISTNTVAHAMQRIYFRNMEPPGLYLRIGQEVLSTIYSEICQG